MQSIFNYYIIFITLHYIIFDPGPQNILKLHISYIGYCIFVAIANNTLYGSK